MNLHAFCDWLGATPLSMEIQNVSWIIPLTQSIHILAISVVIASATMVDLRLLGLIGRNQPTAAVATRFLPWIWPSIVVLLLTGSILITGEPSRSLPNPAFQAKMVLLILAMICTFLLQRPLGRDPAYWELTGGRKATASLLAVLTLVFWVGIIFCGRWIAYVIVE